MPATYVLIASNTLSSAAASVTFSAIPGTYTDLVLKASIRGDVSGTVAFLGYTFNGTSTSYSDTVLTGNGSTASSTRDDFGGASNSARFTNGSTSTSNTFSNLEIYIPNYAGSANKVSSVFHVQEDNSTTARINVVAALRSNTAAITSLTISTGSGWGNLISGSSFFLYGIKNS